MQTSLRNTKRLTLGSLFDGIGGFPLAAQRCGIKTLWASEIEPVCISITRRHFPGVMHLGDITKIHGGQIPPVDIISFGSPCQDLSVAGQQKGLAGERSGLFIQAVRIINEMRYATRGKYPTFIIWENVPGAFTSNKGTDFRAVIETLTKARVPMPVSGRWAAAGMAGSRAGGADIAWRVLDAQFWGVPQRRKRIFLVGDFRGKRAAEILFKCERLHGYVEQGGRQGEEVAVVVGHGAEMPGGETVVDFGGQGMRVKANPEKSTTISANSGGYGSKTGLYLFVYPINDGCIHGGANGLGIGHDGDPAPTITTSRVNSIAACFAPGSFGTYTEGVGPIRARAGKSGRSSSNILVHVPYSFDSVSSNSMKSSNPHSGCNEVDIARTLDASGPDPTKNQGGNAVVSINGQNAVIRKLTPLECERLQGFPDYWTKYNAAGTVVADTPRYTALGNSLAVPCAERVFRGIVAAVTGVTP